MKKNIVALMLLLMAASLYAAVNENVSIMYPLLNIGVGARALGMGGAFTAVADDSSAVYWNPAGLSKIRNAEAGVTYDKWFLDSYYSHVFGAIPLPFGTLGADIVYMNMGTFALRNSFGIDTGSTVNPYNISGSMAYGIPLTDNFSAGISAKIINQSIGDSSSSGCAADAGVLLRVGIFSAGINLQNIGSAGAYSMPTDIRGGVAVRVMETAANSLLFSFDGEYLFKDAANISAGTEYVYNKIFALRAGYKYRLGETNLDGLTGLSAGAGVNLSGVRIDYAMVMFGDLGINHRVSFIYSFTADNCENDVVIKEKVQPKKTRKKN